jgi:hypothetical protein
MDTSKLTIAQIKIELISLGVTYFPSKWKKQDYVNELNNNLKIEEALLNSRKVEIHENELIEPTVTMLDDLRIINSCVSEVQLEIDMTLLSDVKQTVEFNIECNSYTFKRIDEKLVELKKQDDYIITDTDTKKIIERMLKTEQYVIKHKQYNLIKQLIPLVDKLIYQDENHHSLYITKNRDNFLIIIEELGYVLYDLCKINTAQSMWFVQENNLDEIVDYFKSLN